MFAATGTHTHTHTPLKDLKIETMMCLSERLPRLTDFRDDGLDVPLAAGSDVLVAGGASQSSE